MSVCMIVCMPRVNIWIPERELKTIDEYAKANNYKRSVFLWKSALSVINKVKGQRQIVNCDYCKAPSIGRFQVSSHNWELGEQKTTKNLCKLHLEQAKTEGVVEKIE